MVQQNKCGGGVAWKERGWGFMEILQQQVIVFWEIQQFTLALAIL